MQQYGIISLIEIYYNIAQCNILIYYNIIYKMRSPGGPLFSAAVGILFFGNSRPVAGICGFASQIVRDKTLLSVVL